MSPLLVFCIVVIYFSVLIFISYLTSRNADDKTFFTGNRRSPWFIVAFGMIGATLSGVTFISVPGMVKASSFSYFQVILGNLAGFWIIAFVLLPLYYKNNIISIYEYLKERFGQSSHKTGSLFFLVSQMMGASLRLFLVAGVLQLAFFNAMGIPFWVCVLVTILLIWAYTFRAGIKTVIWTDTIQTAAMLLSLIVTIFLIKDAMNLSFSGLVNTVYDASYSKIFVWDWQSANYFPKEFLAGVFIAIAMTGLDQNMMQKNLTCKSLRDAQKNMITSCTIYCFVCLFFLVLGCMLYVYMQEMGIAMPSSADDVFPLVAMNHLGLFAGVVFFIGIIAAAFSSADSSLTALTTVVCVDFLDIEKKDHSVQKKVRITVHILISIIMFFVIVIFRIVNDKSVVTAVFVIAGYTYGPLLGLFVFGMFTKFKVRDRFVPVVAVLSPILTYIISANSEKLFWGYKFGFELLLLNALITMFGLLLLTKRNETAKSLVGLVNESA